MKLKEGSYENIITNELQQDMNLATDKGLVCRKEDIDDAEAPSMLTEHISKLIHNRLTADDLTSEERTDFVIGSSISLKKTRKKRLPMKNKC